MYCIYIYIYIYGIWIYCTYIYTWIYVVKLNKQTCHWSDLARTRLWRVDARDLADLQLPPATQQLQRQQLQLQLDFKPAVTLLEPTNSVPKTNKTVLKKACWSWFSWFCWLLSMVFKTFWHLKTQFSPEKRHHLDDEIGMIRFRKHPDGFVANKQIFQTNMLVLANINGELVGSWLASPSSRYYPRDWWWLMICGSKQYSAATSSCFCGPI